MKKHDIEKPGFFQSKFPELCPPSRPLLPLLIPMPETSIQCCIHSMSFKFHPPLHDALKKEIFSKIT
ncbi:MAG: hypothetical protein ACTSVI_00930 [Promethearchaeota archaeon]